MEETPTWFKLSFGGEMVLYTEPYDYVNHRLFGWVYNTVRSQLAAWPLAQHCRLVPFRACGLQPDGPKPDLSLGVIMP
jgi:hypothetical protein